MSDKRILLKTLLLSTSQWNIYKYGKDKKKRGKVIGNTIGMVSLFLMLMAYCILQCMGYGQMGIAKSIPVMTALIISLLAFLFTFFKTNGYLFNFKEYDMLMSLPYKPKDIAACKFLYMYLKSLTWYVAVSLSMMIGYGIYEKPSVAVYPVWIILSLFLPIIPMLMASFIGFIIAKLGSGFKNKSLVQTAFSMVFIFLCFGSRFFFEDMFRENKTEEVLSSLSESTDKIAGIYLPAGWFSGAVTNLRISDMFLLIGVTILLFEIIFIPVGRSYKKINSALMSEHVKRSYVSGKMKKRSLLNAIAFKEFKRMTGSTTYMTNACFGEVMCLIAGIVILFVDFEKAMQAVTQGAPVTKEMLYPAIPYIIYFFIGMVATTAFTPSLEGKNYWIVKSLPISKKKLYQGKMLFNLYLTLPFAVFTTITFCISAKTSFVTSVLCVILSIVLCAFSTSWGAVCGIKHMRLDWENEIEVIKQGSAVTLYLLPNMFATMGLMVLVVILGMKMDQNMVLLIMIFFELLLAGLSYLRVMTLSKE